MFYNQGLSDRQVTIRHFHGWCGDILWKHRIPKPSTNEFRGEAYVNELVARVIRDDTHDFNLAWRKV